LKRCPGPEASALIDWVPEPAVAAIVTSWPARFRTDRAAGLGLSADPDFDSVIAAYRAESRS
jgi:D-erythronate 2-dehydrogenase